MVISVVKKRPFWMVISVHVVQKTQFLEVIRVL